KTYSSTFTLAQPTTFFVVYKSLDNNPANTDNFVFDSRDSAAMRQIFGRHGSDTMEMYAGNTLLVSGLNFPFANFQIWSGTFGGFSSAMYQNGVKLEAHNEVPEPSTNGGTDGLAGLSLGALSTGSTGGFNYGHFQ